MDLRMTGDVVSRLCFDFAVTVVTDRGFELSIGSDFIFNPSVGEPVEVSPEGLTNREVLLQLFQEPIVTALASEDGSLVLNFAGGQSLAVQPDTDYEAWTLSGTNGFRVVATPGGGLATWGSGEANA
ncbi:DUF6188 family protein [Rhodococcus sp. UNC363MFTsu5.1]|uniref:DUF6188 family protein n=1 Tax=Rhodococcus sp. UNC363MFTsu5.1 TaxID=1449069 RepID=UPI000689F6C4|nr:DUF6188 family protein [Rhodococcus sp. UNC363MFTsu5.1]